MALLPETNLALADWASGKEEQIGLHMGPELKAGVPGQVVGETQYDPIKHIGLAPNPFSLLGMVTGREYIDLTIPEHPLDVNVVVHHDPAMHQLPPFLRPMSALKQALGAELHSSLEESLPGIGDHARLYVVGEADREELLDYGAEIIDDTTEPLEAAEAVAEICRRGLTFVISDFNRLPLDKVQDAEYDSTVAIKANHPYELVIPANVGSWPLGGIKEVNTYKSKELIKGNQYLATLNAEREKRIEHVGIVLARIVFSEGCTNGLDFEAADEAISEAVYKATAR